MMRLLAWTVALGCLASMAAPQVNLRPGVRKVKSKDVPRLGTEGWRPSSVAPIDLAAKIDNAFWHLRNAAADIRLNMLLPIGAGQMITYGKFLDGKTFSVTFPVIDTPPPHTVRVGVIANNGKMTEFHPGHKRAYSAVHPFNPGGSMNAAAVLAKWPTDMPRLTMSHFITGKDVFVPLVRALQRPGSGFRVTTQERTTTLDGKYFSYIRILASRVHPKTKTMLAQYEIVIDPHHFVPLTMRTHWTPIGKDATIVEWAGRWSDLKPDPADFKLPG